MKKIFLALLAVVIGATPAFATPSLSVTVADHFPAGANSIIESSKSVAMATSALGGGGYFLCQTVDDPKCAKGADITAILPICESTSEANCVEALSVTSAKTSTGKATKIKTIGKKAFDADPARGIPAGVSWSLFEVPELKSSGEQYLYAVRVKLNLQSFPVVGIKATDFSATVVPYSLSTTRMSDPTVLERVDAQGKTSVVGMGGDPACVWIESGVCGKETNFPVDAKVSLTLHIGNYLTSWLHGRLTEPNISITQLSATQNRLTVEAKPVEVPGVSVDVPTDKVSQKLLDGYRDPNGNLPTGTIRKLIESSQDFAYENFLDYESFFNGKADTSAPTWSFRSLNPASLGASASGLLPTAAPSASTSTGIVGGLAGINPLASIPGLTLPPGLNIPGLTGGLTGTNPSASTPTASNPLAGVIGSTGTTPSAADATSALASTTGLGVMAAKCMPQATQIVGAVLGQNSTTDLLGLVTTSAMVYAAGPPLFKDGTLDYKVAGLHLNPDDSVFSGRYDLVMDKKTAKCLYGFNENVPVYAEVQIVNSDGTSRVTTATLREDDKWIKLGVYGITFSSPTLKVKLKQKEAVASPTSAASTPVAATPSTPTASTPTTSVKSAPKTSSITCVKGKTIKKVTGASPKCPAGFSKK